MTIRWLTRRWLSVRHAAVLSVVLMIALAGGRVEFGGSGDVPVHVEAGTVESVPVNATIVPVTGERIVGTSLEPVVRQAAETGDESRTVPPSARTRSPRHRTGSPAHGTPPRRTDGDSTSVSTIQWGS